MASFWVISRANTFTFLENKELVSELGAELVLLYHSYMRQSDIKQSKIGKNGRSKLSIGLLRFEINLVLDSVVSTLCGGLDPHSRLTGLWEIQIRNPNSVSQLHALG